VPTFLGQTCWGVPSQKKKLKKKTKYKEGKKDAAGPSATGRKLTEPLEGGFHLGVGLTKLAEMKKRKKKNTARGELKKKKNP